MSQTKVQLVNDVSGNSGFGLSSATGVVHVHKSSSDSVEGLKVTNSTTGATISDGLSIGLQSDEDVFIHNYENTSMLFGTNDTTRFTIANDGDIGVGVSSPDGRFHIMGGNLGGAGSVTAASDAQLLVLESNDSNGLSLLNANDERANIRFGTTGTNGNLEASISYAHEAVSTSNDRRAMIFKTGGNGEKMRLRTSTGGLMIGEDGTNRIGEPKLHVLNGGASTNVASFFYNTSDDRDVVIIRHNGASGGTSRGMINFLNSSGNGVGHIHATGSAVTYNSVSDYRLKENVVAISDGITRLKTLKPSRFNFKVNKDTTVDGFLAHEVTAVPEAVRGIKDETENVLYRDDDEIPSGKSIGDVKETVPKYQEIDHSKLVPLLTAALQEEIGKREALEARVATLEAA